MHDSKKMPRPEVNQMCDASVDVGEELAVLAAAHRGLEARIHHLRAPPRPEVGQPETVRDDVHLGGK